MIPQCSLKANFSNILYVYILCKVIQHIKALTLKKVLYKYKIIYLDLTLCLSSLIDILKIVYWEVVAYHKMNLFYIYNNEF